MLIRSRRLAPVAFLLLLPGCANLDSVHQFASEAAKTTDSDVVSQNYVDRAQRQIDLGSGSQARVNQRKKFKERFDLVHSTTVAYMKALDALATDSAIADNGEMTKLSSAASTSGALTSNQATLIGQILNTLQKAVLDSWRRSELSKLLKENSTSFNNLLEAQDHIVGDFILDLQQEKDDTLLHYKELRSNLKQGTGEDDALNDSLQYIQETKLADIDKQLSTAQAYQKIVEQIQKGHQTLVAHVDDLSSASVKNLLSGYVSNIESIYKGIKSL